MIHCRGLRLALCVAWGGVVAGGAWVAVGRLADAGLSTYAVKALYAGLLLHRAAGGGGDGDGMQLLHARWKLAKARIEVPPAVAP